MAVIPSDPAPSYSLEIEPEWRTLVSTFDSGKEQRRQKWTFAKYNVHLVYNVLSPQSEMQALWDFYMARKGSSEAFYFYTSDLDTGPWNGLYVGRGDGSTTVFDIPGKSTSSQKIYINGQEQGSGWEILSGGGDGNSDRVQFTAAPASGDLITCDFAGFMRIRCRFKEDRMSRERFCYACYHTGLELKGLAAA